MRKNWKLINGSPIKNKIKHLKKIVKTKHPCKYKISTFFFGSINRFSSIGKICKFERQDSYVDLVYQATKLVGNQSQVQH